ncbi:MAG: MarR family winged helix-turn-helix transcriptional regulator [Gemmatimonadaceae bacterium]
MASRRASPHGPPSGTHRRGPSTAAHDGDPLAEPLHRTALHLLRLLRRADDASGVSPARLSALSVLAFGGPTTLGALAAAEGIRAPTMSRLVAELEREGYVRRRADTADARFVQLEATAKATRLLDAGRARRLSALSTALGTLSAVHRDSVERALEPLAALNAALASTSTPGAARRSRRRFD